MLKKSRILILMVITLVVMVCAAEASVLFVPRCSDVEAAKALIDQDTQVIVLAKCAEKQQKQANAILTEIGAPNMINGKYKELRKYNAANLKNGWEQASSAYAWLVTQIRVQKAEDVRWYVDPSETDLYNTVKLLVTRAAADADNPTVRGQDGVVQEGVTVRTVTDLALGQAENVTPSDWKTAAAERFGTATEPEIPGLPELNAEGFLDEGSFSYVNLDEPVWYYVDTKLRVCITEHRQTTGRWLVWYEADVLRRADSDEHLHCQVSADGKGKKATTLSRDWVLAINTDYHQYRSDKGLVIRNGVVEYSKNLGLENSTNMPNLDLLMLTRDGGFKTFGASTLTADEALAMGACDVLCFGPAMIRDGNWRQLNSAKHGNRAPRMAIGLLEENHYLVVFGNGRLSYASGFTLDEMQQLYMLRGCKEAFNLDGGATSCLFFMGEQVAMTGVDGTNKVRGPRSQWEMLTIGSMAE